MAWIELHQTLPGHPKLTRLATRLRINKPQAVGHLTFLWLWALDYAPMGDLSALEPAEISAAAGWTGDAQAFVDALTQSGFLETDGKIHDWMDYAGSLIETRIKDRDRKRTQRKRLTPENPAQLSLPVSLSAGSPPDIQRTADGFRPESAVTQPNPTQPNQGERPAITIAPVAMTVSPPSGERTGENKGEGFIALPGPDGLLAKGLYMATASKKRADAEATIKRIRTDSRNWDTRLKPEWQAQLDELNAKRPPNFLSLAAKIQTEPEYSERTLKPRAAAAIAAWQERIKEIQLATNNGQLATA